MEALKLFTPMCLALCGISCGFDSGSAFNGKYVHSVEVISVEEKYSSIDSLDFGIDDIQVAYAGDNVTIWNMSHRNKTLLKPSYKGSAYHSIRFSPDGRFLAYGGRTGIVTVKDVTTNGDERQLGPNVGYIRSLEWSSNGKMIVASGDAGAVNILDASSGSIIHKLQGYKKYSSFRALFSADDTLVYAGQGDGSIRAWEVESGKEVWSVDSDDGSIWEIALCESGKSILSSHINGTVILWDIATGKEKYRRLSKRNWLGVGSSVRGIAVTKERDWALFASNRGYVELWDIPNWSMLERFNAHPSDPTTICEVRISRDDSWFATAGVDGTIRLWGFH